jgi:D-methionine transport system ATP-binding protein
VFRNPKKEVTKRFVQQDIEPEADSAELLAEFIKENPNGRLVTLTFNEQNANEPVISQAIRQYDADINVVYGKIKQAKEGSFGSLTVLMTGNEKALDQSEQFFKDQGVGVEVIHRG